VLAVVEEGSERKVASACSGNGEKRNLFPQEIRAKKWQLVVLTSAYISKQDRYVCPSFNSHVLFGFIWGLSPSRGEAGPTMWTSYAGKRAIVSQLGALLEG